MSWMRFFRRRRRDDDLQREIASYIAIETDDNLARGMPPAEAHAAAVRKFGNSTRVREDVYTMNTIVPLDTLWQDLKLATRLLQRDRGFAIGFAEARARRIILAGIMVTFADHCVSTASRVSGSSCRNRARPARIGGS